MNTMYSTQAQEPEKIMTDLAREFSRGIELTCRCKFPDTYIPDGQLKCVKQELMYRARIISTDDMDSTDLLKEFEKWLSSEPVVIARGEVLTLVKNPTTELKETPSLKPSEQKEASPGNVPVPIIGGIAGVTVVFVLLIVIVTVIVVVLRKRRLVTVKGYVSAIFRKVTKKELIAFFQCFSTALLTFRNLAFTQCHNTPFTSVV